MQGQSPVACVQSLVIVLANPCQCDFILHFEDALKPPGYSIQLGNDDDLFPLEPDDWGSRSRFWICR
jgi:hypothetical protein